MIFFKRKLRISIVIAVVLLLVCVTAVQAAVPVPVYFFYSDTCPHCHKESTFLTQLEQEYGSSIDVRRYEVTGDSSAQQLFRAFAQTASQPITGVPATFIGNQFLVGFGSADTTGAEIRNLIDRCIAAPCPDIGAQLAGEAAVPESADEPDSIITESAGSGLTIDVPLFGTLDLSDSSLLSLTVIIAAVDGFNPCAMWALAFLILVLLGMQDRKRMWILGTVFILTSGAVYFLFMTAWLEFFNAVGHVVWIRSTIGIAAIAIGAYYFRRFFKMKPGVCEVTNPEQRTKIMNRIKAVVQRHSLWLAVAGIVSVAALVNLVEFFCSFGLPAVYTEALALSGIEGVGKYLYLLLYVFIFMLDDMVIFAIAMATMKAVGTTGRYSRYATLIGGVVIVLLGLLLVFKPEWIMFG